jgi:hypothetical protein
MYKRDKWEKIKNLINADIAHAVHYSSDKLFEHNVSLRYKNYMEAIEIEENWYKEYLRYNGEEVE